MYHFLATISLLFSGVLVERKEESRSWLIATTSQKTPSVTSGEQKGTKAHYCSLGKNKGTLLLTRKGWTGSASGQWASSAHSASAHHIIIITIIIIAMTIIIIINIIVIINITTVSDVGWRWTPNPAQGVTRSRHCRLGSRDQHQDT